MGLRGGRSQLPVIVNDYLQGKFVLEDFITQDLAFDEINRAFDLLHQGKAIRTVLHY